MGWVGVWRGWSVRGLGVGCEGREFGEGVRVGSLGRG